MTLQQKRTVLYSDDVVKNGSIWKQILIDNMLEYVTVAVQSRYRIQSYLCLRNGFAFQGTEIILRDKYVLFICIFTSHNVLDLPMAKN